MDLIERLEETGNIIVLRPERPIEVSRMETDTAKLSSLYQEGYDIARKMTLPEKWYYNYNDN